MGARHQSSCSPKLTLETIEQIAFTISRVAAAFRGVVKGGRVSERPLWRMHRAIFSRAAADVLSYIFPSGATEFDGQMQEAAMSRLYGGIHYRSDIVAGMSQGKKIGDLMIAFAKTDGAN